MKRIVFRVIAIVLALLVGALLYDLYYPRTAKMRQFDPNQVARLETAMWRSYYDKKQVQLFNQLSELLRTQYHMPLVRSNQVAYYAANAAFAFKDGKTQADYEKALPELVKFYGAIRKMSDIPFDVDRVASPGIAMVDCSSRALETRSRRAAARARRTSVSYLRSAGRTSVGARPSARGSDEDSRTKAENGAAMTEEDWSKITELLRKSWHSLAVAVTTSTNLTPPSNQSNGSH